jgi:transposase
MVNIGIDLHKSQFTVCVSGESGDRFEQYPTTEEGYAGFLKRAAVFQEAGQEVRVGVESTGNTRYFKGRMEAAGIGVTVINTLKFKIVNESVKKTDKHDAATIAEFLEKDMLPESHVCTRESEQLRRLLKVRTTLVRAEVVVKNPIHALLVAEGLEDKKASLQSKKGRHVALDALHEWGNGLEAQPLMETIDALAGNVKGIEGSLEKLTEGDREVELLRTIPGCGAIGSAVIRAYVDDIKRFSSGKKFAAYCGLVPWVQDSNERVHHGKITKRGPEELRTAIIQVVLGMRRMKKRTLGWRLMERYEAMKKSKGSGKSITAAARKVAVIIWHMLSEGKEFEVSLMADGKLKKRAESMREGERRASEAIRETSGMHKGSVVTKGRVSLHRKKHGNVNSPALPGKKEKKSAKGVSGG